MNDGVVYELSNCEIMRLDVDDEHYYYGNLPGTVKEYYLSLTRVLDIGAPFPEGLRQYLRITSFDEQMERLDYTGARGSKLHAALQALLEREELDLATNYTSTYEKDAVITFIKVMRFLTPSSIRTELTVADPDLRVAGTTDFVAIVDNWKLKALMEATYKLDADAEGDLQLKESFVDWPDKYKGRSRILLDFKFTGRNAYSHKVQVSAYKTMFNKSHPGRASRAFTWRYSPKHKHGFDFQESLLDYRSFTRIYQTAIEYLGQFPEPPVIRRYPERVRLYEEVKDA